jgi:peptidoglycan/xylan/chitin deacetylase (PgdA/CDA1 family)
MIRTMKVSHWLSKSRGTRNLLFRIVTILARFGITTNKFQHLLDRYCAVASSLGCTPTFAITAVILKRHPHTIGELHRQHAEFAVHGYIHTDYRHVSSEQQVQHFSKAIKIFDSSELLFTGFRAPFLRINGKTPSVLGKLGFQYDSSHIINWNVIDQGKYPKKSWREYNRLLDYYMPLSAEEYLSLPRFINGFVEIPVSMPDDEAMVDRLGLTDEKEISRLWLDILQKTYNRGELFTVQLHPERITFCETALVDVLQQAKQYDPPIWVATLQEIADWHCERDRFSLKIDSEGSGSYRIKADCTDRATLLVKNCKVNTTTTKWANGYRSINTKDFLLESPVRPVIGVSPDSSPAALKFLKTEGFITEKSDQPDKYELYLDDLAEFTQADEKPLSERVEQSNIPVLRYWRWPGQARSALSITGDIDSVTLLDFVLRIFENWRQQRRH